MKKKIFGLLFPRVIERDKPQGTIYFVQQEFLTVFVAYFEIISVTPKWSLKTQFIENKGYSSSEKTNFAIFLS